MMEVIAVVLDVALGAAAFKLAWSVDRSQRTMAQLLAELTKRVEILEEKIK